MQANTPRKPLAIPKQLNLIPDDKHSITIQELDLLPKIPWDKKIINHWKIGETAAQEKLINFIDKGLKGYKDGRNFPAKNNVSHLSPHIHFGEVSTNQVWYKAKEHNDCDANDRDHFLSELGWREFSHSLLYNFPHLPDKNLQSKFDLFPWQNDKKKLDALIPSIIALGILYLFVWIGSNNPINLKGLISKYVEFHYKRIPPHLQDTQHNGDSPPCHISSFP